MELLGRDGAQGGSSMKPHQSEKPKLELIDICVAKTQMRTSDRKSLRLVHA